MATARPRALKGLSDETRRAIAEAAQAEGVSTTEWIERALAKAAEEALNPRPPALTRADIAEVLREELAPLAEMVERLATPRAEGGAASPVEAVRARLRRRRGL